MDIYFDDNYGKLYEKIEGGEYRTFQYEDDNGRIKHSFIYRAISQTEWFDIVTPYGYGGPVITEVNGDKKQLVHNFEEKFSKYCIENKIVSEFVRFHPIIANALDFQEMYQAQFDRKTIGTDLAKYSIEDEFSKSAKKTIKKALKAGVTYEIIENPSEVEDFKKVYYSTMDRDNADEYYYFNDNYFNQCLQKLGEHILYVKVFFEGRVIAAGFYFFYDNILQCHLSGTLTEYLELSPAYIIKIATAEWAKENGIHYIHYGGGTSRSEENSLYKFKKKFGKNTEFDFCVGKRIWNEDAYKELCRLANVNRDATEYFPAYRSKRRENT